MAGLWTPSEADVPADDGSEPLRFDLYDTERKDAYKVLQKLQSHIGSHENVQGFEDRIHDEFRKIGLTVHVKWGEPLGQPGLFCPHIEITGRVERHDFDPERMAHEVQHDVLGTGQEGTVDMDGKLKSPSKSVAVNGTKSD